MVWHKSLPVSHGGGPGQNLNKQMVAALELNRLQICYVGPGRRHFFRDQIFRVMRGLGTKLPIIGADLNCVISVKDIEVGELTLRRKLKF